MGNLFSRRTRQRTALAAESNEDKWAVIYDVWKSKKTNDFSKNLKLYLSKKGYKMSAIIHEGGNKPIIALCLLYSRLGADVEYTVANLSSEQRNRTILILLNYQKEVTKTRIHDDQFENQYPGMTVHNCFLQKDNDNVEEVKKDIWKDLERRETHNKRKRLRYLKQKP